MNLIVRGYPVDGANRIPDKPVKTLLEGITTAFILAHHPEVLNTLVLDLDSYTNWAMFANLWAYYD